MEENSDTIEVYLSTQIQGRLEDLDSENEKGNRLKMKASRLHEFENIDQDKGQSYSNQVIKAKNFKKKGRQKRGKQESHKTITSIMKHKYGNSANRKGSEQDKISTQKTIKYMGTKTSGKLSLIANDQKGTITELNSGKSERDLEDFSKKIKLTYPRTTHKYVRSGGSPKVVLTNEQENINKNVWSQASSFPNSELNAEDLRWLYDSSQAHEENNKSEKNHVSDTDDTNYFLTLSQVLSSKTPSKDFSNFNIKNEQNYTSSEEISNSSPELSALELDTHELNLFQDRAEIIDSQISSTQTNSLHNNTDSSSSIPDSICSDKVLKLEDQILENETATDIGSPEIITSSPLRSHNANSLSHSSYIETTDKSLQTPIKLVKDSFFGEPPVESDSRKLHTGICRAENPHVGEVFSSQFLSSCHTLKTQDKQIPQEDSSSPEEKKVIQVSKDLKVGCYKDPVTNIVIRELDDLSDVSISGTEIEDSQEEIERHTTIEIVRPNIRDNRKRKTSDHTNNDKPILQVLSSQIGASE